LELLVEPVTEKEEVLDDRGFKCVDHSKIDREDGQKTNIVTSGLTIGCPHITECGFALKKYTI
jgi:hypothetical protein